MRKWIQKAIKKKGALRKTAKASGGITKSGKISKKWMAKEDKKGSPKTKRRIALAKTLSKLRKK